MRLDRLGSSNHTDPAGGLGRARAEMHELEDKVRRKVTGVAKRIRATFHHEEAEEPPAPKERQGIVSINGQDVGTMRCCVPKRSR